MAMSDYLITSNSIYNDLDEYIDSFNDEATLINYLKCEYINTGNLQSTELNGDSIEVYNNGSEYDVYYKGMGFHLECDDKMITYYKVIE